MKVKMKINDIVNLQDNSYYKNLGDCSNYREIVAIIYGSCPHNASYLYEDYDYNDDFLELFTIHNKSFNNQCSDFNDRYRDLYVVKYKDVPIMVYNIEGKNWDIEDYTIIENPYDLQKLFEENKIQKDKELEVSKLNDSFEFGTYGTDCDVINNKLTYFDF